MAILVVTWILMLITLILVWLARKGGYEFPGDAEKEKEWRAERNFKVNENDRLYNWWRGGRTADLHGRLHNATSHSVSTKTGSKHPLTATADTH